MLHVFVYAFILLSRKLRAKNPQSTHVKTEVKSQDMK